MKKANRVKRHYYVRVNRGGGARTEAYNTTDERDKVVSWEHGRAVSAAAAKKLDKNYLHCVNSENHTWMKF